MREGIGLFTGKRVDNNEWVEGYLFDDDLKHSDKMFIGAVVIEKNEITGHALYEVIPETIREYTSRRDKNNNRILRGISFNLQRGIQKTKALVFVFLQKSTL